MPPLLTPTSPFALQQDKQNIIAGLRVYERFGLDEHQRYDIQWAFCDSTDKDDCPEDL